MIRKPPAFWYGTPQPPGPAKAMLRLLSHGYGIGHRLHHRFSKTEKIGIPVLCIGNLVAGGGGKTPTALAVLDVLRAEKLAANPCFLSRGYGGTLSGPLRVDPQSHNAAEVGDEPLLLAQKAPAYIAADRLAGARLAQEQGHDFIIMDDGLQNPSLHKDIALLVIDGETGFGNEEMIPAGPLRTPIETGMRQTDAVILIGEDRRGVKRHIPAGIPVLQAEVKPVSPPDQGQPYIAFCGIAHPGKFRRSLEESGLNIAAFHDFPDHYPYRETDLNALKNEAELKNARLITTTKDAVRLPAAFRSAPAFDTLDIALLWTGQARDTLCRVIKAR